MKLPTLINQLQIAVKCEIHENIVDRQRFLKLFITKSGGIQNITKQLAVFTKHLIGNTQQVKVE